MPFKNKKKQRSAQHQSYVRNKEKTLERTKKKREKNRAYVLALKRASKCDCGESHPACLEFHHLDGTTKEIGISKGVMNYGLKRLIQEISKCKIICSNCHRKLHFEEEDNFKTYKMD